MVYKIYDMTYIRTDLINKKFAWLTVIAKTKRRRAHASTWICQCDCGKKVIATTPQLQLYRITSCGCKRKEHTELKKKLRKKGKKPIEYLLWKSLIDRCHNPKNYFYKDFGDVGVYVCRRWRLSYRNFIHDLGPRPTSSHFLRRVNKSHPYAPGYVKWVTPDECENTHSSVYITLKDGTTRNIRQHLKAANICESTLVRRLEYNWTLEEALSRKNTRGLPRK